MRIIEAMKESTLRLGYQGEDERTRVIFDLSDLIEEFGAGTVSLLVVRPWEKDGSPVVISQGENGQYYWDVTDADLQNEGGGEAQIVFIPEGRVAKTHIWKTIVSRSISETENPPEPWQGWVDQVLDAAAEVEQTAQEIPTLIDTALQEAKDSGEFDGEDGEDGFSPLIGITDIPGGHRISITDATGMHTVDVMDGVAGAPGQDGEDGYSPTVSITDITGGHRVTITDSTGSHVFDVMDGADGQDGQDGQDGYSPSISVTDITGGHRVTVTNKTGSQTFDVMDGADGQTGPAGPTGPTGLSGADGYSPTISVTDITGGHRLTITDKNGTSTVDVMDGVDGQDGQDGSDGSDGYSPTIAVSTIPGGHRLTITDANGSRTVDVMDGEDAPGGSYYGTCSVVDSGTGVCTVVSSGFELAVGKIIAIAFSVDVPQYSLMNINNTGAKYIMFESSAVSSGVIMNGNVALFVYDGQAYQLLSIDRASDASGGGSSVPYAICADPKEQNRKSVSIAGVSSLFEGLTIRVKFTNGLSSNFSLNVNNLPSPEDAEITYIGATNLPSGIVAGAVVLELTLGSNSYGWNWFVIGAKFSSDPTPPKMGLGFYYEATTRTAGGGPGQPVYTISEVTVPDDFKVRDSQYRYGSLLVVHFDADVTDNGILCVMNETYSVYEQRNISFRGANITNGVIKQGDTCLFTLRYNESTYAKEWVLLSNDRWGVGVT